jgi:hypothetical protein
MRGATRPQKTTVALEIEVKLGRMGNLTIDDSARWAVTTPVGIPGVLWEESDVMPLANNNHGDSWFDFEFLASSSQSQEFCKFFKHQ